MADGILDVEALRAAYGYDRDGDVLRALEKDKIPYFVGKGGRPWTTLDLVNSAKGLVKGQPPQQLGAEIL